MSFANWPPKKMNAAIAFVIAAVTVALYLPMLHNSFINYDDPDYILGNDHVKAGLTWPGIVWAFQSGEASNWHPLTWISHMLDCQLFGLNPAGHHLTNLLLHAANAVLLFLLLNQLTGARWRSAFVAALFAWHPLRVESVAWASERKDVLSGFFWMLTLLAYTRYAQLEIKNPKLKTKNYLLSLFFFACGLMSKPTVVTLPFVLLLLDFWPLNRMRNAESPTPMPGQAGMRNFTRILLEKLPFFALTAASCIITFMVQRGALWSSASLTFKFRLANAVMSYVRYISKTFWPTDLALIYPYPHHWPFAGVVIVAVVLVIWSAFFVWWTDRFPYLAVGWFWYLGTLVPAIGLVQVGVQSMADRYTYLPGIGLLIAIVWGFSDLISSSPQRKKIASVVGALALAGCMALTSIQLNYWRNSLAIFLHTAEVTTDNYAAYDCLGKSLESIGKMKDAATLYAQSVQIEPTYPMSQFDLGMIDVELGKTDEASNHLAIAAQLAPRNPVMQFDFGIFLLQHGQPDAATKYFRAAIADKPDFPEAQYYLKHPVIKRNAPPASVIRSTQ
jgi:protein O-mannosyl-transferase